MGYNAECGHDPSFPHFLGSRVRVFVGMLWGGDPDILENGSAGTGVSSSSGNTSSSGETSGNPSTSGSGTSGRPSGTTSSGGTSGGTTTACTTPEVEPNNLPALANNLAPMRCGTVGGQDHSDDLTFTLKAGTTTMQIKFSGQVRLQVTVGKSTVSMTPTGQSEVPFVKGQPSLVEVTPLSGTAQVPWTVELVQS